MALSAPLPPPSPVVAPVEEQFAIWTAARRAEDAGDLGGARRLLRLLADGDDVSDWRVSLEAGLRCRDEGERALWLLQPAFRHGFTGAARQALLTLTADVLRTRGTAAVAGSGATAEAATRDPLLVDAALFELGMLDGYLARVLRPAAHPLVDLLTSWSRCRASVFEVSATAPVRARDFVTDGGAPVVVGRAGDRTEGELVFGRIVPLPSGACFTAPPVPVDRLTARRIARAVLRSAPVVEHLRAVASHQRRTGTAGRPS